MFMDYSMVFFMLCTQVQTALKHTERQRHKEYCSTDLFTHCLCLLNLMNAYWGMFPIIEPTSDCSSVCGFEQTVYLFSFGA